MEDQPDVILEPLPSIEEPGKPGRVRKTFSVAIAALASVALFVAVLLTCLQIVAFDEGYYAAQQQKLGLDAVAGVSKEDMGRIMHELLLYCRGDRPNLDMQAVINGQPREVFSQREKDHMVDVQVLFTRVIKLRLILVASFLFLALVLVYVARKRTLRELARGWLIAVAALGAVLLAIGIYFTVDFEAAWTQFHLIFFTNDLWLLYEDDMLIQLLLPLFDGIVRSILIWSGAVLAVITAGAVFVMRRTAEKKDAGKSKA